MSSIEECASYDRLKELKDFDDTKAGVKGVVDAGIVEIPRIFLRPPDEDDLNHYCNSSIQVPVVDLSDIHLEDGRKKIVDEIREASEKWGFFQVINHGVPSSVMEDMIDGIRKFHEQDSELKKQYYSRDIRNRKVRYDSTYFLYESKYAAWKDSLSISMQVSGQIDEPQEIPPVCRSECVEYVNEVAKVGETLLSILSEAVGLKPDHLKDMECNKGKLLRCHYYPPCPQPDLTIGVAKHTDAYFLTILLQNQIGGLQVLYNNQWVDVEPVAQALVVNIGERLQIVSNDKFVSVSHRVLTNRVGPRISAAFFFTGAMVPPKMYGPIKELISKENPPLYKEFTLSDHIDRLKTCKSRLDHFRL